MMYRGAFFEQAKADGGSTFIAFSEAGYKAMADDPTRTPLFARAIRERLASRPGEVCAVPSKTFIGQYM
jgi:hypothetical protein